MNKAVLEHAIESLQRLPEAAQEEVVHFINTLERRSIVPAEKPEEFTRFFGVLSEEEADRMQNAINQMCGQIDPDEWSNLP